MTRRAQKSKTTDWGRQSEIQKPEAEVAARVSVNIDGKGRTRGLYSVGIVIAADVSHAEQNVKETTPSGCSVPWRRSEVNSVQAFVHCL